MPPRPDQPRVGPLRCRGSRLATILLRKELVDFTITLHGFVKCRLNGCHLLFQQLLRFRNHLAQVLTSGRIRLAAGVDDAFHRIRFCEIGGGSGGTCPPNCFPINFEQSSANLLYFVLFLALDLSKAAPAPPGGIPFSASPRAGPPPLLP